MGTKLDELHHGCIAKAANDEPVFVLRAQDVLASEAVLFWAQKFKDLNFVANGHFTVVGQSGVWRSEAARKKYEECLVLVRMMERWPARKLPD